MMVRAFDGTKKEVLKNIELPIQVGPCTFKSKFIVMDINSSYNYLFERPWIHMTGAVPSTLYQKVKFVAYKVMVATTIIFTPYIKVKEDALSTFLGHLRSLPSPVQKIDSKCQFPTYRKILGLV